MAWTAEEVVEEVRGLHPAFDKQKTPDSVLREALDRYHGELYSKVLDEDPHFWSTAVDISFPPDPFEDGFDLPGDFDTPQGGDVHFEGFDRTARLNIVPFGSRHSPGSRWPSYIRGDTLYFIGREEDWDPVDKVEFFYAPLASTLESLSTEADLPDDARQVCVERVALKAADRAQALGEDVNLELTLEDWRDSETQFLHRIGRPAKAETTYIRDVW